MVILRKMAVVKHSLNYTWQVMLSVSQLDIGFRVNTTSFLFMVFLYQISSSWGPCKCVFFSS